MSPVLVDSNVILDIATGDPRWSEWSEHVLAREADRATLVVNPIIYAEVSVGYARIEEIEAVLPTETFRREALPYEAAFLAGKAFLAYRKRQGRKLTPLPDFFIGAHAAVAGYRLLTRDGKRYRTYFPSVDLVIPD